MPSEKTCANCRRSIGALEEAFVWQGNIVCRECFERLSPAEKAIPPTESPPQVYVQSGKSINGLGVTSLVLGIIAVLTCWIPFVGILSIPVAAIGLLFGIIGFFVTTIGRRSGVGMPMSGCLVCIVAIIIAAWPIIWTAKIVADKPIKHTESSHSSEYTSGNIRTPTGEDESHADDSEVLVITQPMFGIFLGETIDSLKKRFSVSQSTLYEHDDVPREVWVVEDDDLNIKQLRVWTFNKIIYEISIDFVDGSGSNYTAIKDQLEKKYKGEDKALFSQALFGECVFIPHVDGVEIRITLNHDTGFLADDTLNLSYEYLPLIRKVNENIERQKANIREEMLRQKADKLKGKL